MKRKVGIKEFMKGNKKASTERAVLEIAKVGEQGDVEGMIKLCVYSMWLTKETIGANEMLDLANRASTLADFDGMIT